VNYTTETIATLDTSLGPDFSRSALQRVRWPLRRGHFVDGRCWAVRVRASCERSRRQGNRLHPERLPHRVLDRVHHIRLLLDVGVLVVGARDTSDLLVEQPSTHGLGHVALAHVDAVRRRSCGSKSLTLARAGITASSCRRNSPSHARDSCDWKRLNPRSDRAASPRTSCRSTCPHTPRFFWRVPARDSPSGCCAGSRWRSGPAGPDGVLMGIRPLPFPKPEGLGPEAGVQVDGGPQHMQDFPPRCAVRSRSSNCSPMSGRPAAVNSSSHTRQRRLISPGSNTRCR
jgi:hypothetical protein